MPACGVLIMDAYAEIIENLKAKKIELEDRLERIESSLRKTHDRDWDEQALEREGEEVVEALDESIRTELDQINAALSMVDRGEYGVCVMCGDPIPIGRLEALPYTDRCVVCARESE